MPFPSLIELYDRQVHHSTAGGVIQNTWYVEPANATPVMMEQLLGYVKKNKPAQAPWKARVLPAHDFEYPHFFCDEVQLIPFDQQQMSFVGSTKYDIGNPGQAAVRTAITKDINLTDQEQIEYEIKKAAERGLSPGAYIQATYRPLFTAYTEWKSNPELAWDYLNPKFEPTTRVNKINQGLKIMTAQPQGILAPFFTQYPDTGMVPEIHETYVKFVSERKMLHTNMDWPTLDRLTGCVNDREMWGGTSAGQDVSLSGAKPQGTLRYDGMDEELAQSPEIDPATGDCVGFHRWYNVKLNFSLRVLKSKQTYTRQGNPAGAETRLEWNHLLVYPGKTNEVMAQVMDGVYNGLGWYYVGYNAEREWWDTLVENEPDAYQFPYKDLRPLFEHQ